MNSKLGYAAHSRLVEIWSKGLPETLSEVALAKKFEEMSDRLYKKAQISVSELTLAAILDRVLYNSSEHHPLLATIKIESGGLDFKNFNQNVFRSNKKEIRDSFSYLIVEFLFIVGKLTGEQLTPTLHAELIKESKKAKKDKV